MSTLDEQLSNLSGMYQISGFARAYGADGRYLAKFEFTPERQLKGELFWGRDLSTKKLLGGRYFTDEPAKGTSSPVCNFILLSVDPHSNKLTRVLALSQEYDGNTIFGQYSGLLHSPSDNLSPRVIMQSLTAPAISRYLDNTRDFDSGADISGDFQRFNSDIAKKE